MTAIFEPKYLTIARKDIGLAEIKGPQHNPRILKAFESIGHKWLNTDEHAWCAGILGLWVIEGGLTPPKNAFRAAEWANWGESCGPLLGAVAAMTRKGGGHVGIITGITADGKFVRVLGGNQGDKVCEAWFEAARITGYRKPVGMALVAVPVAQKGELSKSEA